MKRRPLAFAAALSALALAGAFPTAAPAGPLDRLRTDELGLLAKVLLRPLGLYPEETRRAILEISVRADLIPDIQAHPEKYRAGAGVEGLDPATAAAAAELAEYPDVLGILADFPKYTKLIALFYRTRPKPVLDFVMGLTEEEASKIETVDEEGGGDPAPAPAPAEPPPAEPAPTEPAPAEPAASYPTTINYIYEDEDCAEELAALAAAIPAYANQALANAEAIAYILENYQQYYNTALALLEAWENGVVIPAVQAWVQAAEQALDWRYQAGQAQAFLEGFQARRKVPEFKGRFWEDEKLRGRILDGVKDFPRLAERVLKENGPGRFGDVEGWKKRLAERHGIPFDERRPGLFAESASLLERHPDLKGKLFDDPGGIQNILKGARANPNAAAEVLKRKEGPGSNVVAEWARKKPNAAQNVQRSLGKGPALGGSRPGGGNLSKGQRVSRATTQHKSAWGAQAKRSAGGRPAGGGGRPGRGR